MRYETRLAKLEANTTAPRIYTVFGDDVDGEVAQFRATNGWPDDGQHPVHVIRVIYVDGVDGRPAA